MAPLGSRKVIQWFLCVYLQEKRPGVQGWKARQNCRIQRGDKTTDCRHRTLNPCEQSITNTTNHRLGNSTILLELNSLSRLNYSVHFSFSPSRVCKSCQGRDCQIRRQIRRDVFSSLFLKFLGSFLKTD